MLSLYVAATWIGVILGKLLFSAMLAGPFDAFAICSIAVSAALIPVVLTNGSAPSIPPATRAEVPALLRGAPVAAAGAFAVGAMNGPFWTLAPHFAGVRTGSNEGGLFMAACALGGALSQWSVGQLSDRADRRWIIVGTSAVAAAVGLLLALESPDNVGLFYATGVRFDASALPIYSLCVAHANDGADPSTYIEVSSFLLLALGIGAIVGPVSVSFVVEEGGHAALFVFTATIHLVVAASALLQIRFARPVPHGERAPVFRTAADQPWYAGDDRRPAAATVAAARAEPGASVADAQATAKETPGGV